MWLARTRPIKYLNLRLECKMTASNVTATIVVSGAQTGSSTVKLGTKEIGHGDIDNLAQHALWLKSNLKRGTGYATSQERASVQ